jgi:hypothetical protein
VRSIFRKRGHKNVAVSRSKRARADDEAVFGRAHVGHFKSRAGEQCREFSSRWLRAACIAHFDDGTARKINRGTHPPHENGNDGRKCKPKRQTEEEYFVSDDEHISLF